MSNNTATTLTVQIEPLVMVQCLSCGAWFHVTLDEHNDPEGHLVLCSNCDTRWSSSGDGLACTDKDCGWRGSIAEAVEHKGSVSCPLCNASVVQDIYFDPPSDWLGFTRWIEMRVDYMTGAWDTTTVFIPFDTPDDQVEDVAVATCLQELAAAGATNVAGVSVHWIPED